MSQDIGGGGNPTCAQFHQNPQYVFQISPKALLPVERGQVYPVFLSYESASDDTPVGLYVVEGVQPGDEKLSTLKYDMIVNKKPGGKVS